MKKKSSWIDVAADKVLIRLHNDGAYVKEWYAKLLGELHLELSELDQTILLNRLNLEELLDIEAIPVLLKGGGWGRPNYQIMLSKQGRLLMKDYGSYLNYLKQKVDKEKSDRLNTKGERVLKYVSAFFAIVGTISAVYFGIKSSNKTTELQSSKEAVKHLTGERDSLIRLTSIPQKPQDPKAGLQQPIDTTKK